MTDSGDFMTSLKDANAQDRIGFVRKVYSILFCQLLISGICIAITITNDSICLWMIDHYWLYWVFIFVGLIVEIMMICIRPLRRKVPINYMMLLIFTLCESYLLSFVCMIYSYQE